MFIAAFPCRIRGQPNSSAGTYLLNRPPAGLENLEMAAGNCLLFHGGVGLFDAGATPRAGDPAALRVLRGSTTLRAMTAGTPDDEDTRS
jgi:hypothetical protein